MTATIYGTAVLDERGRVGILDETTGETTLLDYAYSDNVEHDAVLNRTVFATGTLRGAGTDRKVLTVTQYQTDHGYDHPLTATDARRGLRITDARAETAVNHARPGHSIG
jgi:hypothetical protein